MNNKDINDVELETPRVTRDSEDDNETARNVIDERNTHHAPVESRQSRIEARHLISSIF